MHLPGTLRGYVALSGQSLLFAALSVGNVGNFGFHALTSHLLGPASYGAVGSVLSLLVAVTVPLTAYQAVLTAQVKRAIDDGARLYIRGAVCRLVGFGGLAAIGGLALSPLAESYLHLGSVLPMVGASLYLVPLAATTIGWAVLTGSGRFGTASLAAILAMVTRLVSGYALLRLGGGVTGAVMASVASESVLAIAMLIPALRMSSTRPEGRQIEVGWRNGGLPAGAAAGLWLLIGGDVMMARHLFPGVAAGQYAATATIARITLYLPQAAVTALVPSFSVTDRREAYGSLRRALALCAGLSAVSTVVLVLVTRPLTAVMFGAGFVAPQTLVVELSISAFFLGMLYVVVQYHLASGNRRALAAWPGVIAFLSAVIVLHPSPVPLAAVLSVSVLLSLVLACNGLWWAQLPERPGLSGAAIGKVDLSVVVPYYNPGHLLRPNIERLTEALRHADVSFEVIAVSDGSTDGSHMTIADMPPDIVKQVVRPLNAGKGEAICRGLQVAEGRYLGFIDADGDLDPVLWQPVLQLLKLYRPDAIVGSKRHPLSRVDTRPLRRVYSRGYQLLVSTLFRLPVRDTQVGLKVFRRDLVVDALRFTGERGFAFDLELLAVARRLGYRRMMEAPVVLVAQGTSTVRLRSVLRMFVGTIRVAWRLQTVGLLTDSAGAARLPNLRPSGSRLAIAESL